MVAIRTLRLLGTIAVVVAGVAITVASLATVGALILPKESEFAASWIYWTVAILVGIPIALLLEAFGTWFMSKPFLENRSSPVRVMIVVVVLVAVIAVIIGGNYLVTSNAL